MLIDPSAPQVVYAVLWVGRQAPWEIGSSWQIPGSGLYKSSDGGDTWRQLEGGLPSDTRDRLGRMGLCLAPSEPRRLYAVVDAPELGGVWRSDHAGERWRRMATDPRLWGRGSDFTEVRCDPTNPDLVYVANIAAWKSTDGGQTFTGWPGAPRGDDYHRIWIDPGRTDRAGRAWQERSKAAQELTARWQSLRVEAVPALNERLRKAGLAELKLP